jgi:type IV secretion system protein VirD4
MGTGTLTLHQARFAHRHELRGLLHKTPCPDGVLLGTRRDYLLLKRFVAVRPTKNRREIGNVLIVAPSRSGKSVLAISQLLTWKHSVIVNDIKGELFTKTAGYRATLGDVYVIDPIRGVGHCFDPLYASFTEEQLLFTALNMLFDASEKERFWTEKAAQMLQQLFLAAKKEGLPALTYVRHMSRLGLSAVAKRLHSIDPKLATIFLDTDFAQAHLDNKTLLSCWTTLTTRLSQFLTETLVRCFTKSDFTPEQIMRGEKPVTIYLRWKEQYLHLLSPLIRLVWGTLIDELITTYDDNQGEGCNPVLLLIDEAGRTAIPLLADQAATVVGRKIIVWAAIQSPAQLEANYGRVYAQILTDNMDTHLYYPPNDIHTAKNIQDWLGEKSEYARSTTSRDGEEVSEGLTERAIPLLTAQEIRQLKDDELICFHRRLHPFKMKRLDYRNHPILRQRSSLSVPELADLPQIADLPTGTADIDLEEADDDLDDILE